MKKTRSPGWSASGATSTPTPACTPAVRGMSTPAAVRKTHCTKPEQSQPAGEAPPQT